MGFARWEEENLRRSRPDQLYKTTRNKSPNPYLANSLTLVVLRKYFNKHLVEAGCDEAGRGCLAGPVFAAAVILPRKFKHPLLNDSKLLKEEERAM